MKKLLIVLMFFSSFAYGQSTNTTNTKFPNGLAAGNGVTPKPTSGLTAGAIWYTTGVGFQVYNGTDWVTLGAASGGGVTSFNSRTGIVVPESYDYSGFYVPLGRTLTINGTTQDLTANRIFNVGTVTSVGATAGLGISVGGSSPITSSGTYTITNTLPDQTVVLNGGSGIGITGIYPNFTISNTDPSSGGTVTSITPAYGLTPQSAITNTGSFRVDTAQIQTVANFFPKGDTRWLKIGSTGTVTSVGLTGGTGISIGGASPITSSGTWSITNTAPDKTVVLSNGTGINVTGFYPNFTINNTAPSSGGTVTSITPGYGLTPQTAITDTGSFRVDTTAIQTVANFFPKGDTRYVRGSMTTGTIPISNGTRSLANSTITDNSSDIILGSRGLAIGSIPVSGTATKYLVQSSSVAGGVASRAASAVLADIGGLSPTGSGASLTNVVNSITGTANQVIASASTGAVTLSLPQSIATSSTPTFSALNVSTTVAAGAGTFNRTTAGSSVSLGNTNQFTQLDFSNSGTVKAAQYWDNTNTKMFFDANAPHIFTRTNAGSSLQLNNNTQFTQFDFLNNGTAKSSIYWDNTGQILNFFNANLGMQITNSGIIAFPQLTGSVTDMLTITASGVVGRATIPSGGGGGSVTTVGVTTANGLGGTSSGGATPSLTLNTNVVGMVKANGTAFSAATAGTDYTSPTGSESLSNKTITSSTISGYAPLASPSLTGSPTAPTQSAGDNSTKIATTAYVDAAVGGATSGTYTPTLTNGTNVASSSATLAHYSRVGNEVTVTGQVSITVTYSAMNTVLGISLPIASNFASATDLRGVATPIGYVGVAGISTFADDTNDRQEINLTITASNPTIINYSIMYTIIP